MKLSKRILALLLCLVMLTALLPNAALAAEDSEANGAAALPQEGKQLADPGGPISLSGGFLNPLYEGQISEKALRHAKTHYSGPAKWAADAPASSIAEGGKQLREGMEARAAQITVDYRPPQGLRTVSDLQSAVNGIFDEALVHTGIPTQGDYLAFQWGYVYFDGTQVVGEPVNGRYMQVRLVYNLIYYTSAAQEQTMNTAVQKLKTDLGLAGRPHDEIISGVYRWITDHVSYDYTNLEDKDYTLKFSGYAALVDRTAVCQGYAVLLYRMLLEYKVDCRVIGGESDGVGHAWNIVKLGNWYFNVDSTWDAGNTDYYWFMLCPGLFVYHDRDPQYETDAFHDAYPMWHDLLHHPLVPVDLRSTTDGSREHWECRECGKCFANESARQELSPEEIVIPWQTATAKLNGWQNLGGDWYCFNNGKMVTNAWKKDSKGWCYLGSDGKMVTNTWKRDSKGWCYLKDDGRMAISQWVEDKGERYYMNASGYMVKGWQKLGGTWYFFEDSGAMATNTWKRDSKGWCYLGDDGKMVTNTWKADSKGTCYLGADGRMVIGKWLKVGGAWYYMNASGYRTTGWQKVGGKWYYMDGSGVMQTGWLEDKGKRYYLDSSGVMVTGKQTIDGTVYTFNSSGVCQNP